MARGAGRRGHGEVRGMRAPATKRRVRQTPAPLEGLRVRAPVAPRSVGGVARGTSRPCRWRRAQARSVSFASLEMRVSTHPSRSVGCVMRQANEALSAGPPRRENASSTPRRSPAGREFGETGPFGVRERAERLVEERAPELFPRGARVSGSAGPGGVLGESGRKNSSRRRATQRLEVHWQRELDRRGEVGHGDGPAPRAPQVQGDHAGDAQRGDGHGAQRGGGSVHAGVVPCGSNENETTSRSTGSPSPRAIATAGTVKLALPAPRRRRAGARDARAAEYDSMEACSRDAVFVGERGREPRRRARASPSPPPRRDASASSSKNGVRRTASAGHRRGQRGEHVDAPVVVQLELRGPLVDGGLVHLPPCRRSGPPRPRATRICSHGSDTARAATRDAGSEESGGRGPTARFAADVTFTIAARSRGARARRRRVCRVARVRVGVTGGVVRAALQQRARLTLRPPQRVPRSR